MISFRIHRPLGRLFALAFLYVAASVGFAVSAYAQGSGVIEGKIIDSQTKDPLPGANVSIAGTNIGDASRVDGAFRITGVPAGAQVVLVRYLGYRELRREVTVEAGKTITLNLELTYDVIEGKEVVISGQAAGQAAALNQQLSSNTIVNVVSADRIREFPDQNAAESIGRLPGISVQRNAGEGSKVVVRGLSPRFNSITVNGERIPGTDGDDRSVDLSLISPDILAGIEVFKALTPDKDGDAIGGTVNLVLRKAPEGLNGDARFQYGYNNQASEFGQYRGNVSVSNRFFNDKVGALISGNFQRANRSSDLLTADYEFRTSNNPDIPNRLGITDLNLADRTELRERYGAGVTLDYGLGGSEFFFSTFWSHTDRSEQVQRKRYRVGNARVEYDMRDRDMNSSLLTNSLSGNHNWRWLTADWQVSRSSTLNKTPFNNYARFQELGAFTNDLVDDQGPEVIPMAARNTLDATWYQYGTFTTNRVKDQDQTASVNLKAEFNFGSAVSGYFKTGAKIRDKERSRSVDEYQTDFAVIDRIGQENPGLFTLYRNMNIQMSNFVDPSYDAGEFLGGRYLFPLGLNVGKLNDFYDTYSDRYTYNQFVALDTYTAGETVTAGYAMTELRFGTKLMFLPGVRIEHTENDYIGKYGRLRGNLGGTGTVRDTTGGQSYTEILPMAHLRYRFTDSFDVRLAATRTLSRPDYFNLVPYQRINDAERYVNMGNPEIKHAKSTNYDLFMSFYTGRIGLISAGVFYKEIADIDYIKTYRYTTGTFAGYQVTEPTNADESKVYGMEAELQTSLKFLPKPLNGLIFSANYSYSYSETLYPYFVVTDQREPTPPFRPIVLDTVRAGRMPGQADHIGSLALGYELGGFSARLSMIYQGESLQTVGVRSELDGYTSAYVGWDLIVNQNVLSVPGLTVFLNMNNITNRSEQAYIGNSIYSSREEYFGWTGDVGVRYSF